MDLNNAEKFLARARQREEELEKENCFSADLSENEEDVKGGKVSEGKVSLEEPITSRDRSIYPIEQLRRLSENIKNSVTNEILSNEVPKEKLAPEVNKLATDPNEGSKRRSIFADLAANIDNFEVEMKSKFKIPTTKSSSRLSSGETRPSALFTPNTNYYAPLSVSHSPKKSFGNFAANINTYSDVAKNTSFTNEKSVEIVADQIKEQPLSGAKQKQEVMCYGGEDYSMVISHGESGDDEKQLNGPLESTTLLNSPSVSIENRDSKIKKFFEKQSDEYTSPCLLHGVKNYEPSPIPKFTEKPTRDSEVHSAAHSGHVSRGDIVDEIMTAASEATRGLKDLPFSCGRAKEIAMKLEEKAKHGSCGTPELNLASVKKCIGSSSAKKPLHPNTDVHIHYRLCVPSKKNTPRVSPVIDTTPANVKNLRSRWEVSSSTGAPLHPDQDEDDLLEAARRMSRAVKQSSQWKSRPHSYYESVDNAQNQPSTTANSSPLISDSSAISFTMKEKLNTAESFKEDEKCKKRLNTSGDDGDSDGDLNLEKKPKREEKDETKLSGQLVGEALGAFEFLNETSTRNSSFLSSILDNTSEIQPSEASNVAKKLEEKKEDNEEIQLVHSVSFYRKKKKELKCVGETTVLGQFTTSPPHGDARPSSSPLRQISEGQKFAKEKLRLEKEILVQDEQIAQASKALRYCRKNLEFRSSRTEVDAQRALLIAKECRRALQVAYDNLIKTHSYGTHVQQQQKPRGTLTIKDISLRLMRDFINGHINYHNDQMMYYFIVLLRHEETVHHTAMVTSDEGLQSGCVSFPNYIQIKSLPHDFTCTLEVYALRTKREFFSNNATLKKTIKTPSFHQGFSSPGGIAAVIDPSFQKIGTLLLNIGNITKSKFHMVDVLSPLDGIVTMTLTCFPEETGTIGHKGFLSLYQEVESIASWTRFWCVLNDGNLRFWKYPEDEAKKPVVVINLRDSASEEVRPLGVETCPYPHSMTIDIWIESAQKKGKREKIRIMMAADTKEDMHRWLGVLNGSLRNITLWYPKR